MCSVLNAIAGSMKYLGGTILIWMDFNPCNKERERDGNRASEVSQKRFHQPLVEEGKSQRSKTEGRHFFTAWTGGFLEIWEESSFGAQKSLHQLLVEGRKSQTSKLGGLVFLFLQLVCEIVHSLSLSAHRPI